MRELIARHAQPFALVAFEHTVRRQTNITLDALIAETRYWARSVRHLPPSSLERMRRVGTLQRRMFGPSGSSSAEKPARSR